MSTRGVAVAALMVVLATAEAGAEGIAGRLAIAVQAGSQAELSGDLTSGVSGALVGKPATIASRRYRDVFDAALRLQAAIGFGVASRVELFGRGTYYEPKAAAVEAGTFDGRALFTCFEPPAGSEGTACAAAPKTKEYGLEVGVRYYVSPQSRLKTYLAAVAGVRHSEDLLVTLSVPDAATSVLHVPFSRAGTAAVYGADLGVMVDLTPHVFIGVETGVRYQQPTEGFGALPELGGFDVRTGRWTAPVVATLGARF